VDVVFAKPAKSVQMRAQEISAMLSSLAVSTNYETGQEMVVESSFGESEGYFQAVFEVGRRYKVMNPEKMRSEYGKLIYLLQVPAYRHGPTQTDTDRHHDRRRQTGSKR
jgi:hypothetical protein